MMECFRYLAEYKKSAEKRHLKWPQLSLLGTTGINLQGGKCTGWQLVVPKTDTGCSFLALEDDF